MQDISALSPVRYLFKIHFLVTVQKLRDIVTDDSNEKSNEDNW